MSAERDRAFESLIDEEIKTLVAMLEAGGRTVYAFVLAIEPPEKNEANEIVRVGNAHRWHSDGFTVAEARMAKTAFERELVKIKDAIGT